MADEKPKTPPPPPPRETAKPITPTQTIERGEKPAGIRVIDETTTLKKI